MRYGLPYKGSKNKIAKWIVSKLPPAETFVDLFCGGGAVIHAALLSGKYKKFIMNDIDSRLPELFYDCCMGKYTVENHSEWISREDFFKLKDIDAYVALIWSFGNNGKDYIYGRTLEEFKHQYHIAVFEDRPELLKPYGYDVTSTHNADIYKRYLEFNNQIKKIARSDLDSIVRQIEVERLQSLIRCGRDYQQIQIPDNAVIYCDIPYRSTNCGKYGGFDHDRFYEWAKKQDNIFISEYNMPIDFIPVATKKKRVLSAANSNSAIASEMIFTNYKTFNRMLGTNPIQLQISDLI